MNRGEIMNNNIKIPYKTDKDGFLFPDIQISNNPEYDNADIGEFGKAWVTYMKENYPDRISELAVTGELNEYITKVDNEAYEYRDNLVTELLVKNPMPQTDDTLKRSAHMNMIYDTAKEATLNNFLFNKRL